MFLCMKVLIYQLTAWKRQTDSEQCFGAIVTNMPACTLTFCTDAKRSAQAHKSVFRSRWHLEFWRIFVTAFHCVLRPPHTRACWAHAVQKKMIEGKHASLNCTTVIRSDRWLFANNLLHFLIKLQVFTACYNSVFINHKVHYCIIMNLHVHWS